MADNEIFPVFVPLRYARFFFNKIVNSILNFTYKLLVLKINIEIVFTF